MNRALVRKTIKFSFNRYPFFLFLALILAWESKPGYGQNGESGVEVQKQRSESNDAVFMVVEQQPEFPGGPEAKRKFFSQNLVIPKVPLKIRGRVLISFIVNTDGSIQDVKLLKSLGEEYDDEALRVVALMPKWIPGRHGGKAIRVRYIQPVQFE